MKHSSAQLLLLGTLVVSASIALARTNDSTQIKGATLFRNYCLRCHGANGAGTVNIVQNPIWSKEPSALVRIIAFGARGPSSKANGYHRAMPPAPYNDEEIALVTMYAMQQIGHRDVVITPEEVRKTRKQHLDSIRRRIDKRR